MTKTGHNRGKVVLEMDREMAEFIVENCEANLRMSLSMLQNINEAKDKLGVTRETMSNIVDMNSKFKKLRDIAKKELDR